MKYWTLLLASLFLIGLLGAIDAAPGDVLSVSDDRLEVGVGPDDPTVVSVNVTLFNRVPDAVTFYIESKVSKPSWGVDYPNMIALGARGSRSFHFDVMPPRGEDAWTEVELSITASAEGKGTWTEYCTLKVLPFLQFSITPQAEFLLDMPLEGEFNVSVRNSGNLQSPTGLSCEGLGFTGSIEVLDPDEEMIVSVPYSLNDDLITDLRGISGEMMEVSFILDGERLHILFGARTALILLPSLVGGYNNVRVMALGAEAMDVSFFSEGLNLSTDDTIDVPNLSRVEVHLKVSETGRVLVPVRAAATMDGGKVLSNPMMLHLIGYPRAETSPLIDPTVVAVGGGAAVAFLAGSAGYLYAASETIRYRWLLALVPLYSLARGEKVLDHFFRGRLYEYIRENPGVTFTALKKHFGVNNGNLTYHLHRLEKEEMISSKNVGKFKVFYPDGIRLQGCEVVISLVDKELLDIIAENPGVSAVSLIEAMSLGRSRRTVSRHIKELQRKGLIDIYEVEGIRKLYISGDYSSVLLSNQGVVAIAPARV